MDIILYYILRRFFVALRFESGKIRLEKGLILRRVSEIPLSALTKIEIQRTLLLRLLRGKQVTLETLSGRVKFYLGKDEALPFLPKNRGVPLRPKRRSMLFGAFIDTRALSGVVVFSVTLSRIGNFFGSDYYDRIINTIVGTAEELARTLALLHIAVPRITAIIAVFVLAAWLFAFVGKLVNMARFCVSSDGRYLTVRRGLVTLYEYVLVLNNLDAAVSCDTVTTLISGAAPIYCRGTMIFPPADRAASERISRILCRIPTTGHEGFCVRPPMRALFGHCAAPLGWLAGFSALAVLTYPAEYFTAIHSVSLLRSILWCAAAGSLWFTLAYGFYMLHSGLSVGNRWIRISSRSGARLYTASVPKRAITSETLSRNPFQRRSGLCDYSVRLYGKRRFKLRQVPYDKAGR